MTLTLHYHPLSSFCWKVLIGLYENDTPFAAKVVDLGDEADRAAFYALWPVGKFPVIEDRARGELVPESSAVLDYLDRYYPGPTRFTPATYAWFSIARARKREVQCSRRRAGQFATTT